MLSRHKVEQFGGSLDDSTDTTHSERARRRTADSAVAAQRPGSVHDHKSQQSSPTFQYSVQLATDEPLACIGFTHMLTALLKLRLLAGVSGAPIVDGSNSVW